MQKHFLYFCTFCISSPADPNRVLFLFPAKYEQKPSERATKRSIDRATDRSIDQAKNKVMKHKGLAGVSDRKHCTQRQSKGTFPFN